MEFRIKVGKPELSEPFMIQIKQFFLWFVPYWKTVKTASSEEAATNIIMYNIKKQEEYRKSDNDRRERIKTGTIINITSEDLVEWKLQGKI
jgi:hypothetical protein